jgi:hypothetical protein
VVFSVVVLRHLLLLTLGQAVTGQITDQTLKQGKDTHYSIAYTYTDDGQRYTDYTSVSESAGRDMVRGSAVRVTSLHRFGVSRSHIPGAEGPMGPWGWTIGFALFWNTITFAFVIGFVLDPLRHRWMVRNGQAAQGQITGSTVKKGKSTTWMVQFQYATAGGQRSAGEMEIIKKQYDRLELGPATVLYDPNGRRKPIIYELARYAVTDTPSNTIGMIRTRRA